MEKSKVDIDYLARLAQIHLTSSEKKQLGKDLRAILRFIAIIRRVDTQNVPPTFQVVERAPAPRGDRREKSLPLAAVLKNAPRKSGSYFVAKRIGWK